MEPIVRKLMVNYLQAQIVVKRMCSYYHINQFESAATSAQKTRAALTFGFLSKHVEEMEFVLCLLECENEHFLQAEACP